MNYEKKYKEAQKWIESIYSELSHEQQMEAEAFFPELKESEDERMVKFIKKQLFNIKKTIIENYELDAKLTKAIDWLEKQGEPQDKGEISDGYHTFNELYYYRMLYNAAFFNMLPKEWVHKSKKHHDGEDCFGGGWFIVMANLPTGQISNHYELKDWDLFQIPEKEVANKWDGHTPQEAADRLHKYLLEKQDKQPSAIRWYDVSLIPQEMEELLVEWDSEDATWHEIAFYHADTKTFWNGTRQVENVTRWCYITDLLEKQGEQKPDSFCREHCKGFQETGKCFADGDLQGKLTGTHKEFVDKQRLNIRNRLKEVYGEVLPKELNEQIDYIVGEIYNATRNHCAQVWNIEPLMGW